MRAVPSASESALRTGRKCVEVTRKPRAKMLTMAATAVRCKCGPIRDTKRVMPQTSDPLYGSINANEAASLPTNVHFAGGDGSGNPYQGETFVLNDRNYLI